jgi:hypothetical protein
MAKGSVVNKIQGSILPGVGLAIGGLIVGFIISQLAKRGIALPV